MPSHSFPVLNQQFIVDTKYKFIREIGQGAYGVVWYVRGGKTPLALCRPDVCLWS